ncbi:hypothetical protein GLOIN_2v1569819 [Rhizophagus clarus]|uniref:Wax synthase domain-containing protein n=1 Tax=Rhizophagus clarus TaxID=94130 RepID=A0A8H3KTR7_9GLOM|nr:hypothetical protein GLOIN_2v1569819 [Rhizophagus clarus]
MFTLEIPTQISFSSYVSLLTICSLTFIGITLKAPIARIHCITLIIISLIFIFIPLKYGRQISCSYNLPIPVTVFGIFYKMLIWIKKYKQNIKDRPPFYWTLFYWRKNYNLSNKKLKIIAKNNIEQKLKPYLIHRLLKLNIIMIFHELFTYFLVTFPPSIIPDRPYPLRIIDYLLLNKKSFITNPYTLFYCYVYAGFLVHNMNYVFNKILVMGTLILWIIQNKFPSNDSIINSKVSIIKNYLISLLFDTPPLFNQPYFSTSPSDLWGRRWHQLLRECFIEIGYLPISSLFINNNKTLGHIMGLMGSFISSGILHEYIIISLFGKITGEHFTFFVFQGIMPF